jgi:hypothetical protein
LVENTVPVSRKPTGAAHVLAEGEEVSERGQSVIGREYLLEAAAGAGRGRGWEGGRGNGGGKGGVYLFQSSEQR